MHVLVAVDDSDRAVDALTYALETYPEATITALHVLDPRDFSVTAMDSGAFANYEAVLDQREGRAESILESANGVAAEYGREIGTEVVVGGPSRGIVSYADEHDVDHIVIGSHGRTGASRILLGSVAERVARRASVPVTIVR